MKPLIRQAHGIRLSCTRDENWRPFAVLAMQCFVRLKVGANAHTGAHRREHSLGLKLYTLGNYFISIGSEHQRRKTILERTLENRY